MELLHARVRDQFIVSRRCRCNPEIGTTTVLAGGAFDDGELWFEHRRAAVVPGARPRPRGAGRMANSAMPPVHTCLRSRMAPAQAPGASVVRGRQPPGGAAAQRETPVQKAEVSERAKRKVATKTAETGLPAHSLRTMLQDLGH